MQQIRYTSLFQLIVENSKGKGVRFQFCFLLKLELQLVRIVHFFVKNYVCLMQTEKPIKIFCYFHEVAKTSLKLFQMVSTVYMPFFVPLIKSYKMKILFFRSQNHVCISLMSLLFRSILTVKSIKSFSRLVHCNKKYKILFL